MSLNDFHLSPAVLSGLYPSSLINNEKNDIVQPDPPAKDLKKINIETEKPTSQAW